MRDFLVELSSNGISVNLGIFCHIDEGHGRTPSIEWLVKEIYYGYGKYGKPIASAVHLPLEQIVQYQIFLTLCFGE